MARLNRCLAALRAPLLALALVDAGCDGGTTETVIDVGPRSTMTSAESELARDACTYKTGTLPGLSLAKDAPLGAEIPIDTIVVLMMENRSFDHMLATLNKTQPDVDVAPLDATLPDSMGKPVARYRDTDYCFNDTNHEWTGSHEEFNDGKNDGFVIANENHSGATDGARTMSYYTAEDIPFFYWMANTFSVADRYFCGLLGPTLPNREYLYAATSFGNIENDLISTQVATLMGSLETGGVNWHIYYDTFPGQGVLLQDFAKYLNTRVGRTQDFFDAVAAGTLENVVFFDPDLRNEYGGGNDLHPPGDVQNGDAFLANVVDKLMHSPQWPHMALFITFDEAGGLYDHVPPPKACEPDELLPKSDEVPGAKFDRYGFRVPAIVVSPYAKAHSVSHKVYSHTSIVRFIEARWKLPALTARDANADPMYDMFDFSKPALLSPPTAPTPVVDQDKLKSCITRFPKQMGNP